MIFRKLINVSLIRSIKKITFPNLNHNSFKLLWFNSTNQFLKLRFTEILNLAYCLNSKTILEVLSIPLITLILKTSLNLASPKDITNLLKDN